MKEDLTFSLQRERRRLGEKRLQILNSIKLILKITESDDKIIEILVIVNFLENLQKLMIDFPRNNLFYTSLIDIIQQLNKSRKFGIYVKEDFNQS